MNSFEINILKLPRKKGTLYRISKAEVKIWTPD